MGYDVGEVDPALAAAAGYTDQIEKKAGDYGVFSGRGVDGQGNLGVVGDVAGALGDLAGFTNYNTQDVIDQRIAAEDARIADEKAVRVAALPALTPAPVVAPALDQYDLAATESDRFTPAPVVAPVVKKEPAPVVVAPAPVAKKKKKTSSALKNEMSKQQKNVSAVKSGTYKRSMGGF